MVDRLQVIAHRGASGRAPESTRAALQAAVRANVQMIELDVQMTADGRLVVFHDARLERTTDGRGWLRRTPYARLKTLDAGRWFHPRFMGERILLLSDVFALIPRRIRLNLELKRTRRPQALLRRLLQTVRRHRQGPRLLISSFDASLIAALQRSPLKRALICRRHPEPSLRRAIRLGCTAWHPHASLLTRARLAAAHRAGLRVHVWTVDDVRQANRLRRWGVDGIFTNHPERFRQVAG